jgi:ribosomal protein S18 acetylase RimI-like enzyme
MTIALRAADRDDLAAIVTLMNRAFRGEQSWSTEAPYISGDRANEAMLQQEIAHGAQLLIAENDSHKIEGCVSLKSISPQKWYLGSLAVDPALQNSGFGRRLLQASEDYAANAGATRIEITVVNVRDAIIAWYERRGYVRTGETRPFPYGDNRFGTPLRDDLNFVVLEKQLTPSTNEVATLA